MPYLTIARIGGDPDRLLDAYRRTSGLMDRVGADHGLILHAAAGTPEGLLIVNLWPAQDGSDAAAADPRRLAALERAAVSDAQQTKEHHELERYVLMPSAATASAARVPLAPWRAARR
jgi:hypothetical protein